MVYIDQELQTIESLKVTVSSMNDIAAAIRFDPWCRPQYEVIAISKGFGLVFGEAQLSRIRKDFLKSLIQVATRTDNARQVCVEGNTPFNVSIARKFEVGEARLLLIRLSRMPTHPLTQRERETIERMDKGLSNDEIAAQLHIGVNTVRSYIRRVYVKLKVSSRAEAVHVYREIRAQN